MSYFRRIWKSREGTNLNKFTKTSETTNSVILTNSPDSITQAGTPFSADAMNNIETGIEETRERRASISDFYSSAVNPMCSDSSYIYAVDENDDIHRIPKSTGVGTIFSSYSPGHIGGMCQDGTYLYVLDYTNSTIYRLNLSTGAYVSTITTITLNTAVGLILIGDYLYFHNQYYVYKVNKNTGTSAMFASTPGQQTAFITNDSEYIYICGTSITANILKIKISDASVSSVTTSSIANVAGISIFNDSIVVSESSSQRNAIYLINKISGYRYDFIVSLPYYVGRVFADNAICYFYHSNLSTVKKMQKVSISDTTYLINDSSVLQIGISVLDVTLSTSIYGNILLAGALTANRQLILPTDIREYKIINNCTGSYYVQVKTASGTGVYLAPGDIADVYCDGANIKMVRMHTNRQLILPTITYAQGTIVDKVPLSSVTPTSDLLNEISGNRFYPKNQGKYQIQFYAKPSINQDNLNTRLSKNGNVIYQGSKDTYISTTSVRSALTACFTASVGDYFDIDITSTAVDPAMECYYFSITHI